MKTLTAFLIACFVLAAADSQGRVRGYRQHNGTYVMPYHRTSPDHSKLNNWSSKGISIPTQEKEAA